MTGKLTYPQHVVEFDTAELAFRKFLLGETMDIGPYRQNLFFTPSGVTSGARLPEGFTWYSLRGVDLTTVYSPTTMATYAKLPGIVLWTSLVPPDPGNWSGTLVRKRGTIRSRGQVIRDGRFGDFFKERIQTVWDKLAMPNLSERQRQKISETVEMDPNRALNSRSHEAFLDGQRIAFENQFKTK